MHYIATEPSFHFHFRSFCVCDQWFRKFYFLSAEISAFKLYHSTTFKMPTKGKKIGNVLSFITSFRNFFGIRYAICRNEHGFSCSQIKFLSFERLLGTYRSVYSHSNIYPPLPISLSPDLLLLNIHFLSFFVFLHISGPVHWPIWKSHSQQDWLRTLLFNR